MKKNQNKLSKSIPMKKHQNKFTRTLYTFLIILFTSSFSYSVDPSFTVYIDNAAYTSSSTFEFDIMIKAASPTSAFDLRTFQAGIWTNPTWVGGGTISLQNVAGSTQLSSPGYNGALQWNNTDNFINCAVNIGVKTPSSCISSAISSSSPIRVTRLRMTTSTAFNCAATPNLQFNYTQNVNPVRLHTSVSWRINGTCAVNYEMFYPARPYGGQAYFNGELWSLSDADGKSPSSLNANSASCSSQFNVTALLEGYYNSGSGGQMASVLNNQNVPNSLPTQTDTLLLQFRSVADPSNVLYSQKQVVATNGLCTCEIPASLINQNCWLVVNHRSSVQTWSAAPILITSNGSYNFTNAASQAYGDNQVMVQPGFYAIYTGDVNQDGFVGGDDVGIVDNDNLIGIYGDYYTSDINGDGFVGGDDVGMVDNNNLIGVYVLTP